MMNVVLSTPKAPECGSSLQMRELALGLADRGCRVRLVVPTSWGTCVRPDKVAWTLFDEGQLANSMMRALWHDEPVLVHTQKLSDLESALHLRREFPNIVVVAQRATDLPIGPADHETLGDPGLSAIVAVADAIARRLCLALKERAPCIEVIRPSAPVSKYQALRPPSPDAPFTVGVIANHYGLKRVDLVVEAFAQLGGDSRLLLLGNSRENTASLPAKYQIDGNTIVAGWVSDISPLLESMHVVVLASDTEGLPAALIEAMAAGRPVIATNVGGVPELVTHQQDGLLIPPKSVTELTACMRRLREDQSLRARLGAAAAVRAREFDDGIRLEQTLRLYRRLLDKMHV